MSSLPILLVEILLTGKITLAQGFNRSFHDSLFQRMNNSGHESVTITGEKSKKKAGPNGLPGVK
jgi:hypothetical protein